MNLAEALLAADAGKITKKDVKDFEVKRLTKIVGEPFILHLQQIPNHRVREIQDDATFISKGRKPSADTYKLYMGFLIDGITNQEFNDKEVLKKFRAATRKDLFEVLFNAGEVQDIAQAICGLCGLGNDLTDKVEEVKN